MKRGAVLRTRKPLRRRAWLRARSKTKKYRRRERDLEFMRFVKHQPCIVRALPPHAFAGVGHVAAVNAATPCWGRIEPDHAGDRGLSQKADDTTCIPLCAEHHRQRTDHTGTFRHLIRDEVRAWRSHAIAHTQAAWRNR